MSEMYVFVKFESEDELKACRVCLATDVPLYGLSEYQLVETFGEFIGFPVTATDGLPQHICSVCHSQLAKSATFRAKCRSTQTLLSDQRAKIRTMTTEFIRNLDTGHLRLPLAVNNLETIDLPANTAPLSNGSVDNEETPVTSANCKRKTPITLATYKRIKARKKSRNEVALHLVDDNDSDGVDDTDFGLKDDDVIDVSLDEQPMDVNDSTKEEIFVKEEIVEPNDLISNKRKSISKRNTESSETKRLRKRLLRYSKETKDTYRKMFYDNVLDKYVNNTRVNKNAEDIVDILDSDNEVKVDETKDLFDFNNATVTEALKDKNMNPNKKIFYKYIHEKYINKKTTTELKKIVGKIKTRAKRNVKDKRYKDENEIIAFAKTYNFEVAFLNKEEQLIELQARKLSLKYKKGTFRCELCFFGFQTETVFKKHMAVHDADSGSNVCEVCSMRFERRTEMLEHHRRHHMLKYTCKECGKCVTYSSLAKQHYEYHKGVKYECEHCGKKYSKYASRMDHIRIHHGNTVCEICYETFQGPLGLKSHKTKAHKETAQCASCSAHFDNKDALKRHIGAPPGSACQPHIRPCTKCGYNFTSADLLNEHISQNHNKQRATAETGYKLKKFQAKNKGKLCTCADIEEDGDRIESTYPNLGTDVRYRTNDREQYSASNEYGLGANDGYDGITDGIARYGPPPEPDKPDWYPAAVPHATINRDADKCASCGGRRRRPRKPKNFLCEICADRRFTSEAALKYHQRIHTGERPFQCPVCPKSFRVKENLHNHVNTHTGDRPYQCAHCPKAFRTNTAKHRHQLVHTKKRPYRCDICDKTFQTSTYLKVHVKTVHMKIPMPPRVRNRRRHLE